MAATVSPWALLPFVLLLLLIAAMPLAPTRVKHWWERFYPAVSLGLAVLVASYYVLSVEHGAAALAHTARDYFSFICLVGSLFVIAGGIHLRVSGEATPAANVAFLAIGALVANVIGTTGASMVLIRPWIRMNKIRASGFHVVFFIFVISNIGGALTPIGDPPLFLGYLRGVPFFWLPGRVMLPWLTTLGLILAAFYAFDLRSFRRMPAKLRRETERGHEHWTFEGAVNVLLLLVVIGAVFLPPIFPLRESVMIGAAVASWILTSAQVHAENHFSFGPIREVAFLFAGIFVTMLPALDLLASLGPTLGFVRPLQYYFASGALSSVLDNAPTYLNFFQLAQATAQRAAPAAFGTASPGSLSQTAILLAQQPLFVIAVSLGSVFFGAMTYIGNGPNFMVRSIAHEAGVHCPSFLGYIARYSLPILLPILVLVGWWYL